MSNALVWFGFWIVVIGMTLNSRRQVGGGWRNDFADLGELAIPVGAVLLAAGLLLAHTETT